VLVVTAALTLATVVMSVLAPPPWDPWVLYTVVDVVVGAVYGVVGWLVLRRGGHAAAWIVAAAGVGGALSGALTAWATLGLRWPGLAPPGPVAGGMYWLWIPGYFALTVVLPWLLPVRRSGRLDRAAVVAGAALAPVAMLHATTGAPAPWRTLPYDLPAVEAAGRYLDVLWFLLTLAAGAGVLVRRRTAPPDGRPGLGWLAVGVLLLALAILPLAVADVFDIPVATPLAPALMLAAQAFYPAAVLVVVLRQRLWGLRLAVRRTLVWSLMTAIVVGAYTLGVLAVDRVLPAPSVLPEALVTAVVAAAFQPVRQWVQRRVDRLVHGESGQPLIRQVAAGLRYAEPGQQMLDAVGDGIARSLRLAAVTITTGAHPAPPGTGPAPLAVPLISDRTVGVLSAWPRPGERLGRRAASLLTDLAPMVAALVELAAAQDELDRARVHTARARDEERRRLRRDLHDELGPALSGLALGLGAVRNMLRDRRADPAVAAADELVGTLAAEAERRAAAVRDLARDLLPPVLDDGALRPALDQLAERYAAAGLTVEVRAPRTRLPAEVATAAYGIVAEAVRNVHRHAGVERCMIDVVTGPEGLEVSVTDHGVGFPPGRAAGVGTRSMRERAEGIGGRLTVGVPPSGAGTRVALVVPA